jgi:hypothetical protein
MPDPLSAAERYRKAAAEFSHLAKSASNPFFCGYYQRLAQRYFLHAENQMKLAKIESVLATEPGREDHTLIESHQESPALSASPRPVSRPTNGRRRSRRSIDLASPGRHS